MRGGLKFYPLQAKIEDLTALFLTNMKMMKTLLRSKWLHRTSLLSRAIKKKMTRLWRWLMESPSESQAS